MKNTIYNVNSDNSCTMNISTQSMKRTEPVEVSKRHSKGRKHLALNYSLLTVLTVLLCLLVGGKAWGQTTTKTVYDGSTTNDYVPAYMYYFDDFTRSQFVIPADALTDLGDGAVISKIAFYANQAYPASGKTQAPVVVYLKEVNYTSINAFESTASCTTVYSGTLETGTDNVLTIAFNQSNYIYHNGNLLIGIENTEEASWQHVYFYGQTVTGASVAGSSSSLAGVSATQRNFLPKTTFTYTPSVTAPTVTTSSTIVNLTSTSVTLGGQITSMGGASTVTAGVCYGTANPPTTSNSHIESNYTSIGTYNKDISGLTAGTRYYYRAFAYNSANSLSSPSYGSTYYFDTPVIPCTPTWSGSASQYITNFKAKVDGASTYAIDNTTTGSANSYSDYFGNYAISAEAGNTIFYNTTANTSSTWRYGLWIDWNKDGDFADSGEEIYMSSSYITISEKQFTIPVGTTAGSYRMRVIIDYYGSGSDLLPCGENRQGECEDYKLIVVVPTCSRPTDLVVSNITNSSAKLTWTPGGSETAWQYSINDGSWTNLAGVTGTTTKTATITGLTANTPYTVKIRANCGGDYSNATGEVSFRTDCGSYAIPYTYDFEEADPFNCWTPVSGNITVKNSTSNSHESSYYLDFRGTTSNMIALPQFTSATNTLRVEFWTRPESTGGNSGKFAVGYMTDINDASTFVAVDTYNSTEMTTSYVKKTVDFTNAPAGANIAMRQFDCSTNYYWYVDDVTVTVAPSCSRPTGLTIASVSATGATITWDRLTTPGTGETITYCTECVPHGETPLLTCTEMSFDRGTWEAGRVPTSYPSGLSPNTEYDFYVYRNCGGGDYSEPIMITFRTACGEESVPWSEDFEGEVNASNLPYCWEKVGSGTVAVQATNVHGGSKSLKFSGASSNLILLPEFSQELNTLQVSLWTRPESTLSSCGSFDVGYVTDASDASTFVSVKTYSYSDFPSASYAEEIVYLVSAPSGARLAFRHRPSSTSYYWFVDDINIDLSPACFPPSDLTATVIGATTATLGWEENGTATSWTLQYGTNSSFTSGTYTQTTASETPSKDLTGLSDLTTYYARVRANCGGGNGESEWSETFTFTTKQEPVDVGDGWSDNFEGTINWVLDNGALTNAWAIGTAAKNGGSKGLYISNDGGTSNAYTVNSNTVVYATKLFTFATGQYTFAYDWKANGESGSDYLRVALIPSDVTLAASTSVPSGFGTTTLPSGWIALDDGSKLNGVTAWQSKSVTQNVTEGNYYVAFVWRNDGSVGTQPPAAIDNFSIARVTCYVPFNLTATSVSTTSATLSWAGESSSYNVRYRESVVSERFTSTTLPEGWENKQGLLSNVMNGTALTNTANWFFGANNGVFDSHARINIYGSTKYGWLITPQFVVGSDFTLNFDLALTAFSGTGAASGTCVDDRFVVLIWREDNNTWNILREWNNSGSLDVYNNIPTAGTNVSIGLSGYINKNVKIAFYGESTTSGNGDNNLHIDNVLIGGAWQTRNVTSETVSLTDLTPETSYDWQSRAICSGSPTDWSDLSTFTTIAMPPCTPPDVSIGGGTTPTCSGTQQTLTANVSGGETPYSYTWGFSATGSGSSTISSNAATVSVTPSNTSATASTITYKVTVNDNAGCSNSATKEIVVRKQPSPSFSPSATTLLVGGADYNALATLNADGCSSPTWTSSPSGIVTQAGGSIHAVAQGNTTVTASYAATANYCAASANLAVTVNVPHSVTISSASAACTGSGTSITASAIGFTNPQYTWSASPSEGAGLPDNIHTSTITVTPDAGNYTYTCEVTEEGESAPSYSIGDAVYVNQSTSELVSTSGSGITQGKVMRVSGNTITALFAVSGGQVCGASTAPTGATSTSGITNTNYIRGLNPTSGLFSNMLSSWYSYAKGFYVPSISELDEYVSNSNINNLSASSSTFASASGTNYSFYVYSSGTRTTSTGATYTVCKDFIVSSGVSGSVTVNVFQAPSVSFSPSTISECSSPVSISADLSGTDCNSFYQWTGGSETNTYSDLSVNESGTYYLTVTNRYYQQYDMITQNGISAIVVVAPTMTTDGKAVPILDNIIGSGNTADGTVSYNAYTYLQEAIKVNGGNTYSSGSRNAFKIPAGAAGGVCQSTASVEVILPDAELSISEGSHTDVTCHGGSTGSITVNVTGGTADYQYKIDGGSYGSATSETSKTFSNLAAGSHTVYVKDNCNVEKSVTVTITEPAELTVLEIANALNYCMEANATALSATASNGIGSYTYQWQSSVDHSNWSNVGTNNNVYTPSTESAGTIYYRVVVTDNCESVTTDYVAVIVESASTGTITASATPSTICIGSSATLSVSTTGNSGAMSYVWEGGSTTVTPNVTTTYTVTATATTAVAGCTAETTKDVTITVTTPSVDGIASGDMVWSGNAGTTNWATADNWLTYDGSAYSVAASVPSSSTNVFLATYGECVTSDPVLTAAAATQNLTIGSGRAISLESNTLSVAGNLTNSGTFTAGTGTVVFNGSTHQTISGSSLTFYNVTFDNDKHFTFSGLTPTVNAEATFSSGIVNGNMNFGASATTANASLTSHVDGKVTKAAGSGEFTFPTGNAGVLGSVTATVTADTWVRFHNLVASGDDLPADYPRYWNVADNCSGNDPQFDHVSNFEYWDINSPDGLSGAIVVASADNANKHFGSTDPAPTATDVFGAIWTGSCWNNIGGSNQYVSDDYTTIIVRGVNIPSVTRAGTPYFTLGSKAHETLLPIELLSFTATCDGRSALVEWTTATERNNDYFVLERSDDAINFTEVARVAGAGNSIDPIDYAYTDYGIHGGDNYYRIVQVDYDGTRAVSEVVVVNCIETAAGEPDVQAYPNPFYGELTLELDNFDNRPARIDVYDMLGKLIYTDKVASPQNYYETVLNLSNLPPATYTVRVSTADFVINKKVVKQ